MVRKATIKKAHQIAKGIIKHRRKVRSPYAVGMYVAKKSAKYLAKKNKS